MDLLVRKWHARQQIFLYMSEIAIMMPGRRDAIIHLNQVHIFPRDVFARQLAQHLPGRAPAAHRENKLPARKDRISGRSGNDLGRLVGYCGGVWQNLNFHHFASVVTTGFTHPSGGETRDSASAGPHVPGPYSVTGVPALSTGSTIRHASST